MRPAASLTNCYRRLVPAGLAGLTGRVALATCFVRIMLVASCAAQDAPATFPVDGVVENSLTHQPIARALVESVSDAVLTDNQGHFELHLPAGFERLNIRRPGYDGPDTGGRAAQLS